MAKRPSTPKAEIDELDRYSEQVQRVRERVAKELIARIEAEVGCFADDEVEDKSINSIGWGLALAEAMIAVHVTGGVPVGILMEMIVHAFAEARRVDDE